MNRRNRRHIHFLKTFKDYSAPIVLFGGIFLVGIYALFATSDAPIEDVTPPPPLQIIRNSPQTQADIQYVWWTKAKLESDGILEKSEKIFLSSETAHLQNTNVNFHMSPGELSYDAHDTYTLLSGNLWVEAKNSLTIHMRYLSVQTAAENIFSLSQNEITSSLYVVQGSVEITTNAWASTKVSKGERIVLTKVASEDKSLDLVAKKEPIDEVTKNDEWFRKNNAASYLAVPDVTKTPETSFPVANSEAGYISFSNSLFDRAEINTNQIDIAGMIHDDRITIIEMDGKNADIDLQAKTFVVRGVNTSKRKNDLVYYLYEDQNEIYRGVLTLYNASGTGWGSSTAKTSSGYASTNNFPLTNSAEYPILFPKQNPYITRDTLVTLEWAVPARTVTRIVVNGFQLTKFVPNSTNWAYNANVQYDNLKDGVNIYTIEYFNNSEKVFEQNVTIIKE